MNFSTKNSRLMLLILRIAMYIVGKMAAFKQLKYLRGTRRLILCLEGLNDVYI
jgi:hypothetical protein